MLAFPGPLRSPHFRIDSRDLRVVGVQLTGPFAWIAVEDPCNGVELYIATSPSGVLIGVISISSHSALSP